MRQEALSAGFFDGRALRVHNDSLEPFCARRDSRGNARGSPTNYNDIRPKA